MNLFVKNNGKKMFDQEQKMKIWKHKTKDKEIYTATTIGRNDKFIHDDIYMTVLHYFSDLCLITIVNSGVKIFYACYQWVITWLCECSLEQIQFPEDCWCQPPKKSSNCFFIAICSWNHWATCANCLYSNYMLSTHFRIQQPAYFETIGDPCYLTGSFLL